MCGIVGVLGTHEAAPLLVESLKRLEYRGYDSAGIATINDAGQLDRRRAVGKLVNLSDALVHDPLQGKSGIITFVTETDTETVALLAQEFLEQGKSPREAVAATLPRLEGAFALCFLFDGEEDLMIAARKGSPLAIGHGDGEMFVGSDAIALAPLTDRITYLDEGDWAVITRAGAEIIDQNGQRANRPMKRVRLDAAQVGKDGYKHFMAKEIAQQPTVVGEVVNAYVRDDRIEMDLGFDFADVDRYARLPVDIDVASEFRYREAPVAPRTAGIFVSQSGETADTLAALRYSQGKAAHTVALINQPESSIARESDVAVEIHAGVEVSVASTKAFTCQLTAFAIMALKAAHQRGHLDDAALAARLGELRQLPGLMSHALAVDTAVEKVARKLALARDVLFLGRGQMFPLALEGALKLKEISYIHAEGYASGELKHGPIALVDSDTPTVVMAPRDGLFDKTVSNMQEVMARGGRVVLVTDAPILYAVPAQLLAYHTAIAKGTDVDQPRNLAKSVTVE